MNPSYVSAPPIHGVVEAALPEAALPEVPSLEAVGLREESDCGFEDESSVESRFSESVSIFSFGDLFSRFDTSELEPGGEFLGLGYGCVFVSCFLFWGFLFAEILGFFSVF